MSGLLDVELLRLIQNGDQGAGSELFKRYGDRIYYLALRDLRSRSDAEDVRAETFLRVLRAIQSDQVRTPKFLSSFILGTARNVVLEMVRSPLRGASSDVPERSNPDVNPILDEEVTGAVTE